MKHTTEELILAAHLREAALRHRAAALATAKQAAALSHKEFRAPAIGYTERERQQIAAAEKAEQEHRRSAAEFERDWLASNPVENFVPAALRELAGIATVMKTSPDSE